MIQRGAPEFAFVSMPLPDGATPQKPSSDFPLLVNFDFGYSLRTMNITA
jgi:hypothetical protein